MIDKLRRKEIVKAAEVYIKGLKMEKPRGYSTLKETISKLKKLKCFVYKSKNSIHGLITFRKRGGKIKIDFVCSMKLREGIGRKLIERLAVYSKRNKIKYIYSNVSSKDKRAMKFYESLGFKKYNQYYSNNLLLYKIKAIPKEILKK